MTPAEHIAAAEKAEDLSWNTDTGEPSIDATYHLLDGILHALIAIAVEGGVPHATVPPAGT